MQTSLFLVLRVTLSAALGTAPAFEPARHIGVVGLGDSVGIAVLKADHPRMNLPGRDAA